MYKLYLIVCMFSYIYMFILPRLLNIFLLSTDILITVLLWMKLFAQEIVTECCYKRRGIHFIQEFNGLRV